LKRSARKPGAAPFRGHSCYRPSRLARNPQDKYSGGYLSAQAILAALVLMAGERKGKAAFALAELLGRRGLERPCEVLVAWGREA
jgi:hypothetical protein